MNPDLPHRTQALYDRLKNFPEAGRINGQWVMKPDAYLAMLDLRQLLAREILPALHAHRECGEFVRIPRLEETSGDYPLATSITRLLLSGGR